MRVSEQYAKTHLDDLLSAAVRGEDVEIELTNAPIVRMSVVEEVPLHKKRSLVGALKGQIWMADDFKSHAESEAMADLFEGNAK